MSTFKKFKDGITSLTNKLANNRNSHNTNRVTSGRVDWDELRAIYRSGVGSKIIRLKSGAALSDTIKFESVKDEEFYDARLDSLVKMSCKFMLAFGRSLLIIHERGGDLSRPLPKDFDVANVQIHIFSGDMVYVQSVNFDLTSINYFKPNGYSVRGSTIHPSRVVDFTYVKPVEHDAPEYFYGGISEFELIRNELVGDQIVQRAVPAILEKSSTIFYKVKDFKNMLADKKENDVVAYFQSVENLRSIYGAGILDQEDAIESVTQALANLAESDMITLRRLAMVTGIPLSWLVGEAARGMNSTGDGEKQVFMQTIDSLQSEYLLEPINRLMMLFGKGRISFKKNQGRSANEKMDFDTKAVANAKILWEMGEDYAKYLSDNDVIVKDDMANLWIPSNREILSDDENLTVDSSSSLNGAQVTAILEIISRISKGEIEKETAVKVITASFPLSYSEAEAMVAEVRKAGITNEA